MEWQRTSRRKWQLLGYSPQPLRGEMAKCLYDETLQEELTCAELAIAFIDSRKDRAEFFLGALHACLTPTILLTATANFVFHERTPREYQARVVDYSDLDRLKRIIDKETAIFEEEYVDLENQDKVARYAQ